MSDAYLDGIRVLDLTQYLAGPSCTRMLMEMGADVVKVEQLPYGDPSRAFAPRVNKRAGFHVQQNRGKRSVAVDMRSEAGVALVRSLAAEVDVLVENFSPGVMERRGLGYETLAAAHPRLIMVSISGFGQTGPLADKPAFDFVAQAYAGVMHMTGEPDGPPLFVGVGLADTNAGVHAFGAIGHALFRRSRTGRGTAIDISMVDALVHMHETGVYAPSITDGEYVPARQGRHYQPSTPGAAYKSPDGWIVVFCTQGQLPGLFDAMGRPELLDDEHFATNDARLANRAELTDLIEAWMATHPDDASVLDALDRHRVPSSKVLSPAELGDQPHLRERGMVREVDDPRIGQVTVPGFPIKFADAAPLPDVVAPALGEHNAEVLQDWLGFDDEQMHGLVEAGVIDSKDR